MDIFLPSHIGSVEKIILLIHGGAWGAGQKEDMYGWVTMLQPLLPEYCIVTMGYQLGTDNILSQDSVILKDDEKCQFLSHHFFVPGTEASPGFPKQLHDIQEAISFLKSTFTSTVSFGLIGSSAGAHLSMLYAYSWDASVGDIKAVVSHVGPADLSDPNYTEDPVLQPLFYPLVGPCTYATCPETYLAASPITYVAPGVVQTIGFYGAADPLVPSSQMPILRAKLESAGIPNNFTVYSGGHGDWVWDDVVDMVDKVAEFFETRW